MTESHTPLPWPPLLRFAAAFIFLRLFKIGETAVPMDLNRPFNLYIDSG